MPDAILFVLSMVAVVTGLIAGDSAKWFNRNAPAWKKILTIVLGGVLVAIGAIGIATCLHVSLS